MDIIIKNKPWFKEILKKPELQDITLRNLYDFFLQNDSINKVLPIITSNSNISIRVLDWFVTNYSKKFNIIYELPDANNNCDRFFNVYLQYKCQLKGYKKKLFDPFCRKQRIAFYYAENKCAVTTIGQLNFFKWAMTYGILEYVEKNLQVITSDMIKSNKDIIKKYKNNNKEITLNSSSDQQNNKIYDDLIFKPVDDITTLNSVSKNKISSSNTNNSSNSSDSDKIRKKRHELSISANKTINIHNYSIVLSFD
jgi:hypothetical protein